MCDDMHDFMSSSQTENNLDFKFMSSPNNNRSTTHNNVPEGERSLTEQLYALRLQNQQQRVQISSLQQDVSFVRTAFSCEMERMRHEFDIRLRQLESMFRLNVDMLNKSCGKDKDKDKEKEKEKEKLKMQKKDSPDDEINMNAHERGFWRGQGQGGQGHGQESCCDDGDDTMTKFSHPPPQPMNGMAPPVSISSPRALAVHRLDAVRRSRSRGNSPNQKGRQNNIPLITPLCLPSSSSSRASNTNTNTNANNLPSSSSSATCGKRSKICTDRGSGEDITQADLVSLACSILIKYGSVPVGKMGSLLHKAANNHALPALLKERYGGLKKFLQSHDHFILGDDHPYNPHVSISPEALANHTSSPMVERMMGEVSNCRNNRKKRKARSRSISLTPQESQNIANNSNNNSSHNSTHKNINNHNHNHNHNHHNNNNNNHNNDPSVFPPSCSSGAGPSSSSSQTSVSGSSVIAPPSSSSALLNSSHPMSHNHSHAHSHSHHSQHHSHSHSSSHPRSHGHSHQHQHQHQSHNHHPHAHSHNHSHPPTHPHVHNAHAHVRPHGHGHGHSHGQHPSSHQHSHGHSQPHGHAHSRNPCQPTSAASSLFNNSQLFFPPPSSSPSMCLSSTVISSNTAGQSPSAPHTHNHSFTMTNLNKGSTPLPSASACSTGTGIGGAGFGSCIKSNSTVSGNNDNSGNSGRCSGATTSGEAATNHSDSGVNITRVTTSIAAISSTSSVGNSGGNSTSSENASKSGSYHSSSVTVKTEGGSQESSSRCNARALVDEVAASLASNLHAPPICNAFMPMDSSPSAPSSRPISPPTTSNIDLDKVCQAELTDFLSMDCELIETGDSSNPNVVSRVSIVNYNSMLVYDKYVRTVVIGNDIRTNNDDSKSADELKDICAEVAAIIKDRVLVGHSVIADLKALSLTHPQHLVRDAAYYPPLCPYRPRSLKCLVKERLGVDLQGADTCSIEDARAVLAVYKSVKNEWEADVKRFYGPRPSTAHPQHSPCSGYSSAK